MALPAQQAYMLRDSSGLAQCAGSLRNHLAGARLADGGGIHAEPIGEHIAAVLPQQRHWAYGWRMTAKPHGPATHDVIADRGV
jgi:hypothetical protein